MTLMNKKIVISILAVIAIGISFSALLFTDNEQVPSNVLSISYVDTNKELQSDLALFDIHMSSPLKLNGLSIKKYCTFFSDEYIQKTIEYCTSTELLDSKRQFLGNIQMVGSNSVPKFVIGAIQSNPSVSQLNDIKIIINSMMESIVCDCWEQRKPGGFESVSLWIDAANSHHLQINAITSKSEIKGLSHKPILLEITTNDEGYLWKFIISN